MPPDVVDDDDSSRGGSVPPDSRDDGKGSSSTQIRKAQNRIAQREFRLRKQQYIRDLEARVEILSGDKEERVELTLLLVRNLLKENKELRTMVKTMAAFVGEGLGSCLPRLGLSAPQLDAILNRADTDTAYEAFVALKASKELEAANPGLPLAEVRRRASTLAGVSTAGSTSAPGAAALAKRKRTIGEADSAPMVSDEGDWSTPDKRARNQSVDSAPVPPNTIAVTSTGAVPPSPAHHVAPTPDFGSWDFLFPDFAAQSSLGSVGPALMPAGTTGMSGMANLSGFGLTVPPAAPPTTLASTTVPPAAPPPPHGQIVSASAPASAAASGTGPVLTASPIQSYPATPEEERQRSLRAAVAHLTAESKVGSVSGDNMTRSEVAERRRLQEELRQSLEGHEAAERKTEALQLITYHLNNFRVNHEYALPPSLQPTPVQRTVPHEHAIDGIIFPSVRDRMILLRGRYDLVEAFHGYIEEFAIHGDDTLDHRNWEVSEKWLNDFKMLADNEVYAICNKWRALRGLVPLIRPENNTPIFGDPM